MKTLSVQEFVNCKIEELASDRVKKEKAKIVEESFEKSRSDWHLIHMKDFKGMHRCYKCNSNKTSFYQL